MSEHNNVHIYVEIAKGEEKKLEFHHDHVTGRQIKEAAGVPLESELAAKLGEKLEPVSNDETVTIKNHEHFAVVSREIKVLVHYMPASKPFKTEASPATTVGQVKTAALKAFGLAEDATKVYKLFHHKTELTNLNQPIGEIAKHEKELSLNLEEVLVQGAR